jgi:hypothetical protein
MNSENEKDVTKNESSELGEVAEKEHDYLHQRLRDELGREPTEEELNEWLRQHTEGY